MIEEMELDNLKKFETSLAGANFFEANEELKKLENTFAQNPYLFEAWGRFFLRQDENELAIQNYRKALSEINKTGTIRKDVLFRIYADCSTAYQNSGNPERAAAYLNKGLELDENNFLMRFNLGVLQLNSGKELEAAKNFEICSKLNENSMEAWYNFGLCLLKIRRFEPAIASFTKAIEINPEYLAAINNRANAKKHLRRTSSAINDYLAALKIDPEYIPALKNISSCYEIKKDYYKCLNSLKKVATLEPTSFDVLCKILCLERQICDWSRDLQRVESLTEQIIQLSERDHSRPAPSTFNILNLIDDPKFQLAATTNYTREKVGNILRAPFPEYKKPAKNKKIKIGYFSADFHDHATMHLMIKMFELHDKSKFEIIAFSFGPALFDDPFQNRLKKCVNSYYDVSKKSDLDISNLGRELKLDIGVDLKGHTTDCRPKIFAFGVAPIQISYLGFPGTIGDKNLDYIIGDKFVTPLDQKELFTESIIQMPHSYQVNDDTKKISRKKITRQDEGLPENRFIFSCFNNNYKIGPDEFDVWCKILKRVPKSVLWLFESNEIASQNLKKEAKKRGISPDRLIFASRKPVSEHLARHKLADLTLDTFNYNAHTTGSDSLWSGVPIVTKIGKSFPARVGASLLSAVGLEELITHNIKDYEDLAVALAKNKKRLTKIKTNLTKNKAKKPLFNTKQFTQDLENCYINVIKNH